LADYDRCGRADQLFGKDKVIGAPLTSIQVIQDLPPSVKERLYFVRFEDLTAKPVETMAAVYRWLELAPHTIDTTKLTVRPHESDSHYRYKYLHRQQQTLVPPQHHEIPPRIQKLIKQIWDWFYEWFYPEEAPTA
jgi:sulfotransferase